LYSISSELNKIHSAKILFEYFLAVFVKMTGACSAVARRFDQEGELRLMATYGVVDSVGQEDYVLGSDCFCGEVALSSEASVQFSVHSCAKCVGKRAQEKSKVGAIFIPLKYQSKTLGVFNLFFDTEPSLALDERALLESIADNIAIALDRLMLNEKTKRLALSQERLFLSQEIHDSLAQTIYSLNLQVSVLQKMLKNESSTVDEKIVEIQNNITQANQDLRELMGNFRAPLDVKGIEISLDGLLKRFEVEAGIATYFQIKGRPHLSAEVEMQMMRISQEALSNIRKHAKARNVRILLSTYRFGVQLLIEDDGIGFEKKYLDQGQMGHNIGMNIMKERAQRIGASLEIESELGEGTQIIVNLNGV
jgi:two-component system nitrate/nitrite sensor histidine kinase NarX